jgi:hypothetical protein
MVSTTPSHWEQLPHQPLLIPLVLFSSTLSSYGSHSWSPCHDLQGKEKAQSQDLLCSEGVGGQTLSFILGFSL